MWWGSQRHSISSIIHTLHDSVSYGKHNQNLYISNTGRIQCRIQSFSKAGCFPNQYLSKKLITIGSMIRKLSSKTSDSLTRKSSLAQVNPWLALKFSKHIHRFYDSLFNNIGQVFGEMAGVSKDVGQINENVVHALEELAYVPNQDVGSLN